jgi:hypothetical protein
MLESIKASLNKIKEKMITIDSADNLIEYLHNYKGDTDLTHLLNILRQLTYDDIKGEHY